MFKRSQSCARRLRALSTAALLVGLAVSTPTQALQGGGSTEASDPVAAAPSYGEAEEESSGHARMLKLLQRVLEQIRNNHLYLSDRQARALRARHQALTERTPEVIRWEVDLKLGEAEQRVGHEEAAIEAFERAYALLPRIRGDMAPGWEERLLFDLAVAYLRRAETENCSLSNAPENCMLPIPQGDPPKDQASATKALHFLRELLPRAEPDSPNAYTMRWLLNLAHMMLGDYPQAVPPQDLIPPEAFSSEEPFPRFRNVALEAGLDTFSLSGGVVAEDFNTDGFLDLLVSTYDPAGQIRLFINNGDGTFTDHTDSSGLIGIVGGLNMVQGDYDNDGDIDVLMLRGAWLGTGGRHPNSLLRNNGDGTFTDVTFETGLGTVHYPTQTASWSDYDNDGDLDLYVGNETNEALAAPCELFQNQGDGTFKDVAAEAGVTNDRFTKAVIWGDYDADRWPDLFVSNLDGDNRLYHANGDGTFTDVAPSLALQGPSRSFPAWFWDVDNDGILDLFVSGYDATTADVVQSYLGKRTSASLPRLYRGDGQGRFDEVGREWNLTRPNAPMGANFGDLDNDGFPDFYLGTGYPPYYDLMPNVMYHNQGGSRFTDVSTAGGFAHLQKGHAVAFADLDNDGDQDVFEQMGGALAGDKFYDALYRNPGSGNHWITIQLVGTESNRSAIGARIHARVVGETGPRDIYKHVNSGGTFGANSLTQTLGLGRAERLVLLEVYWPTSGRTQRFRDVPMDGFVLVVETRENLTRLPLPRTGAP